MGKLSRIFSARTGLEWGLFISGPFLFAWGLATGTTVLIGTRSTIDASAPENPWVFAGLMVFHALCCVGLIVSLRKRHRNKGRWFPEE